jgi:CxxC-x17-CxxC domain-containing protein
MRRDNRGGDSGRDRDRPRFGGRSNFNQDRGYGGGGQRSFGQRPMHDATCAECGEPCKVPFKPTEGRPVYCRECYSKQRSGGFPKPKED